MNAEAHHGCKGNRGATDALGPCKWPLFSSLLHTDIGGNQNTAVRKKRVSTEVTLKRSNNLTAHQHSTCVWLNLNNSHRQGLLFLDTSPYVKISTS